MENENISSVIFKTALDGLELWDKGVMLDSFLDEDPNATKYRRSISSLLYTYFRNRALIEFAIAKFARDVDRKFMTLISVALTESWFHTGIPKEIAVNLAVDYARRRYGSRPAGFINAVLRRTASMDPVEIEKDAPLDVKLNLPQVLYKRWKERWSDEELANFAKTLRSKPPFTFRLLTEIPGEELKEAGCYEVKTGFDLAPFKFYGTDHPENVFRNKWLEDGKIYVQDPVTVLSAIMLNPTKNDVTADLCAAPGGKAMALAELMKGGTLLASDSSFDRQKRTVENFAKSKCGDISLVVSSDGMAFKESSFDAILLDVPCSNTGVGRHKPDALWRFSIPRLNGIVKDQKRILYGAAKLLKPGGRLVYSTCSVESEENSMQVKKFVSEKPQFILKEEKLILPTDSNDGAYVALIEKKQ
ncbi:MAG: RsmB/NOP family class I SAM-dependent RNA methyltransferase [Victivallales bacterium]|jgi:16S rRNA (cytosine967-C5)-methyltransferase